MRIIYLHGFASSPNSKKAQFFYDKFKSKLELVDLNSPDFEHLLISQQLKQIEQTIANDEVILIGSSLGGLISLILAEKMNNVRKVILMAPAIGINSLWEKIIGSEMLKLWQQRGKMEVYHYGYQKYVELHYRFIEDLRSLSDSDFKRQLPALIFHGKNDETIPVEHSCTYAKFNPHAILNVLDDEHSLELSLEQLWNATEQFLLS